MSNPRQTAVLIAAGSKISEFKRANIDWEIKSDCERNSGQGESESQGGDTGEDALRIGQPAPGNSTDDNDNDSGHSIGDEPNSSRRYPIPPSFRDIKVPDPRSLSPGFTKDSGKEETVAKNAAEGSVDSTSKSVKQINCNGARAAKYGLSCENVVSALAKVLSRDDKYRQRIALSLSVGRDAVRICVCQDGAYDSEVPEQLRSIFGALVDIGKAVAKLQSDIKECSSGVKSEEEKAEITVHSEVNDKAQRLKEVVWIFMLQSTFSWLAKSKQQVAQFKQYVQNDVLPKDEEKELYENFLGGLEMLGNLMLEVKGDGMVKNKSMVVEHIGMLAKHIRPAIKKVGLVKRWERDSGIDIHIDRHLKRVVSAYREMGNILKLAQSKALKAVLGHRLIVAEIENPSVPLDIPRSVEDWNSGLLELESITGVRFNVEGRHRCAQILHNAYSTGFSTASIHCECALLIFHHGERATGIDSSFSTYEAIGTSTAPCSTCRLFFASFRKHSGKDFELKGTTKKFEFPWILPRFVEDHGIASVIEEDFSSKIAWKFRRKLGESKPRREVLTRIEPDEDSATATDSDVSPSPPLKRKVYDDALETLDKQSITRKRLQEAARQIGEEDL